MRSSRWLILAAVALVAAAPLAFRALGVHLPGWLTGGRPPLSAADVPAGDQEVAWVQTATSWESWEQFVSGLRRAAAEVPGLTVDDRGAFPEQTTAIPEVVLGRPPHAGRLRFRWYKVTRETPHAAWVEALARRTPAPLAVVGGWSSDRAKELGAALAAVESWHGDPPLFFITEATLDEFGTDDDPQALHPGTPRTRLVDVYPGRTFRFCFGNRQMAQAVSEFVMADPGLRPGPVAPPTVAPKAPPAGPTLFALQWEDDPFSADLAAKFKDEFYARLTPPPDPAATRPPPSAPQFPPVPPIPFSVGGFARPNPGEAEAVRQIVQGMPPPGERAVVILPTVTAPARRVLLALSERVGQAGRRLVAVTGDGFSVNTICRDAEFQWPARSIPIPIVMFTHHNPFAWEPAGDARMRPEGKNSTREVLGAAEIGRFLAEAVFPDDGGGGMAGRSDEVAARIRARHPETFDGGGNRRSGTGEHVLVVRAALRSTTEPPAPGPDSVITVHQRGRAGWRQVKTVEVLPEPADRRAPE